MSTFTRVSCVTAVVLFLAIGASAQNLVITNARVLDGTGKVIDRGTVVVRDGKIASVSNNAPPAGAGRTIDAGGKTVTAPASRPGQCCTVAHPTSASAISRIP